MTRLTEQAWFQPCSLLAIMLVIIGACAALAEDPVIDWDAPGDDGNVGTASGYMVAWSLDSLRLEQANDSLRRGGGFTRITGVTVIDTGLPDPLPAGTPQMYTLTGLPDTVIFVAIKAFDERRNMGPMSNVVSVDLRDQIAPAAIILRLR